MRAPGSIAFTRRCATAIVAAAALLIGAPLGARAADPWLFVNDVHLNPSAHSRYPVSFGQDTNPALLASALAEMRRIAPNPPVIVMAGDFLAHHLKAADAVPTMVALARRFNAVFPRAQFVIALGNDDSDCGDYAVAMNSTFLRAVANAWAPLVNRNGAAPNFIRTFSHDGFYTARLPTGVRAVVVDDAFWSTFYHHVCGPTTDPTLRTLGELDRALPPSGVERRWLIMHIPPGIDAASTVHLTRHLAIVPFLQSDARERFLQLAADPARHVELVVTGHVHRFAFRVIPSSSAPVPLLVSPAISPIYGNNPSFLTADVARNGTIRNLEEHSRVSATWRDVGGSGTLGVSEFSGPALVALQRRLAGNPDLRQRYAGLYVGDSWPEINERNWRSYWCAADEFTATSFRDCLNEGGFSFLTWRGVAVVAAALGVIVVVFGALVILVIFVVRRRRRHESRL
jgi:hypothetical protein